MGCRQSKAVQTATSSQINAKLSAPQTHSNLTSPRDVAAVHSSDSGAAAGASAASNSRKGNKRGNRKGAPPPSATDKNDVVYRLLFHTVQERQVRPDRPVSDEVIVSAVTPPTAAYKNPATRQTPLHVAVRLLDQPVERRPVLVILENLLDAYPEAVYQEDAAGAVPLHYAVAPPQTQSDPGQWRTRMTVVQLLLAADDSGRSLQYLQRNDVVYDLRDGTACSPLYRIVQQLPDDFGSSNACSDYVRQVVAAVGARHRPSAAALCDAGNAADGDKPLALLYRRFTRQFDLAEKFFEGDNSRPEVVEHRRKYKQAAGNTWKMMELLLRPTGGDSPQQQISRTVVHRAVQRETPPDLLRYIVETNAEDLTLQDAAGNLPLHYAAKCSPIQAADKKTSFPAFYSKYVIDELLYKFPEAASRPDAQGLFPLTLAVRSGKQWIGGGIKSLYDAYPEALRQINLDEHAALKRALSQETDDAETEDGKEEKAEKDIIRDNQHDAIMLVQQEHVDVSEVVTSMWAHEEDAGVQMLGCVAISRLLREAASKRDGAAGILRIALSAVPAVVNAMKAHPNEVIVQEKACHALKLMASSDGKREVSFVASGAVAAIVGAMQAHVSDAGVQEEACCALARITQAGGADRATIVASVSGLTAIVNAIAAHPNKAGVQQQGCRALRELTEYPHANLPDLPRSQTGPLLEAAKRNFPAETAEDVDMLLSRLS